MSDFLKKLKDPNWRLSHLYKIVTKDGQLKTFKPNPIQQYLNENDSRKKIILKARQFGISTNEILKCLDFTIWNRNVNTCILAHEHDALKKLFTIVRLAVDNMHPDLKPIIDKGGGSKYEIRFPEINSVIFTDLEVRGASINKLHVSEMAFMKDSSRLNATLQAVPKDGEVGIESTPNGLNSFYEFYYDKSNDYYKRFFFPFYFHDEYAIPTKPIKYTQEEKDLIKLAKKQTGKKITKEQIAWMRMKKAEIKEMFYQEYPTDEISCFLSSGSPAIDQFVIDKLIKKAQKPIFDDGQLKIYKDFKKGKTYVIGADTAEGGGAGDFSVAHVYCVEDMDLVACLRGRIKPYDFAHAVKELAQRYQKGNSIYPLVAIERNNMGYAVILELEENIKYRNLFKDTDGKTGWLTSRISRPIMLNAFIDAIETNKIKVNDIDLLKELMTLINNKGKIEAVEGKHDDCVISSAIALQMAINSVGDVKFGNLTKGIYI